MDMPAIISSRKKTWRRAITRREWMGGALAGVTMLQLACSTKSSGAAEATRLSMPGLFRGRVVEVTHPAQLVSGVFQGEPIRAMMRSGMAQLTGTADWKAAWKLFVEPGDVVGIKVNPVGSPHVISSPEVLREIIGGLNEAGIANKEIVVYDRYRKQFVGAGFDKWLPEGVRWAHAAEDYEEIQQAIEGYDRDVYMAIATCTWTWRSPGRATT